MSIRRISGIWKKRGDRIISRSNVWYSMGRLEETFGSANPKVSLLLNLSIRPTDKRITLIHPGCYHPSVPRE